MKKLPDEYRRKQNIHIKREEKKLEARKKYKHIDNSHLRVFSRVIIRAPKQISLFQEDLYEEFILFLTDIRDQISKGEQIRIDFKYTNNVKACALISLYAHIDFFQQITENPQIIDITNSQSNSINQALKGVGIWELVGFDGGQNLAPRLSQITSGMAGQDGGSTDRLRSIITFVRDSIFSGNMGSEDRQNLFAAITESVSNVGLHAYPDDESEYSKSYVELVELMGKKWWIVTQKVENQLFMLIYDLGEGIPCSLVKRDFFSKIKQLFNPQTDAEKIQAALKYGETRMRNDKHGKGLPDMKKFVVDNPDGQLHIFSGMGQYSYDSKSGNEAIKDHTYSIGGTLIQWNVIINNGDRSEN